MDDENVHIVGYDGHSNFGRNIPDSLKRAPEEAGKKVIFYGLCAGKDNIHNVRGQYPDSQVLTTFNSSYFRTKNVNGRKQMYQSENFNVLMKLVEGAVKEQDWKGINKEIRDDALFSTTYHPMPGGTNYISPVHTDIRRKVLDVDHDGQADYLDKLVDFGTHQIDVDTSREFSALPPDHPVEKLDGTVAHIAAMGINTATGYNPDTKPLKKQNILGAGYFQPEAGEKAIVKFEHDQIDGQKVLKMFVNANHAHMSPEALRAVGAYQVIMETADTQGFSEVDRKLMGLTFAAALLTYDAGRWGRDDQIWEGLLDAFNLPADIPFSPIKRMIDAEHHDYTGSRSMISKWKDEIPPAALQALENSDVGRVG
jgi:hypothetical protein